MRYPMVRRNNDGTEVVVNDAKEAYADPEKIACFLPDKDVGSVKAKDSKSSAAK